MNFLNLSLILSVSAAIAQTQLKISPGAERAAQKYHLLSVDGS